ncbi:MAG: flavin reductase family protein [Clostridia bacterium]|nr:flavin reductase family protein [Clostridia bacterium]
MKIYTPADLGKLPDLPTFTLGEKWMALGAADDGKANLMTASWGGFGTLWGRPVAFVFLRPERYTFGIVSKTEKITLSFFDEESREMLRTLGTLSGRNCDKCALAGAEITVDNGFVLPRAAKPVVFGHKLFETDLAAGRFIESEITEKWYRTGTPHTLFVYEVEKILSR